MNDHSNTTPHDLPARLISPTDLAERIDRLTHDRRRYRRLWAYYRNPLTVGGGDTTAADATRPYRQAQEWGLPARITGVRPGGDGPGPHGGAPVESERKEVVIENDIGWRIDTMADYLFGKPIVLDSAAPDPDRRSMLSALIRAVFAANGGVQFLQQLALIGAVYGFVDVVVTLDPTAADPGRGASGSTCATQNLGAQPMCDDDRQTSASNGSRPDGTGPSDGPPAGQAPAVHPSAGPAPCAAGPGEHAGAPDDGAPEAATTGRSSGLDEVTQTDTGAGTCPLDMCSVERIARMIRFEIVEPARALPLLSATDYRVVEAYAQVYDRPAPQPPSLGRGQALDRRRESVWERLRRSMWSSRDGGRDGVGESRVQVVDVLTPTHWARYEDGRLVSRGRNALAELPLVHIQNVAVPFEYSGASDVEPLVPLQDELNTRLSDRASRITLQSFRMYLGKSIEQFDRQSVGPGRMWTTDNPDAEIVAFGGDTAAPSEDLHIADVREALDKTSGVTPIAVGAIKGRIGRLTSAAALRITLLSLLAKNERKRTTYGAAIARMAELALGWLDVAGVVHTRPDERRIEIHWPSPLPENTLEKLQEAESKLRLGVARDVVLRELGY